MSDGGPLTTDLAVASMAARVTSIAES